MQMYRCADVQMCWWFRGAEEQRSRGAEVERLRGAEVLMYRGADVQICRSAGAEEVPRCTSAHVQVQVQVLRCRGAEVQRSPRFR